MTSKLYHLITAIILIGFTAQTVPSQAAAPESDSTLVLNGQVTTLQGLPIVGAEVRLDTFFALTDAEGRYAFTLPVNVPPAHAVTLFSDNDPLNGLDFNDVVRISQHILGAAPLAHPYKWIAADMNGSSSITTLDLILLRKAIELSDTSVFNNVDSWAFFPTDTIALADTFTVNFIGIKMGDVDCSANPGLLDHNVLSGTVFMDGNVNCLFDDGEVGIPNVTVQLASAQDTSYALTSPSGNYRLNVPSGTYTLSWSPPSDFSAACFADTSFTLTGGDARHFDIGLEAVMLCSAPSVELGVPDLLHCAENTYTVHYCNQGTGPLANAWVELAFPPALEVMGSSLPWTSVEPGRYVFGLGELAAGDCGQFTVTAWLSCNSDPLLTHCVQASIATDPACLPFDPSWDQSSLSVSGYCDGDTVRFQIINEGEDMLLPSPYYVVEDDLIMMSGEVQLPAGQAFALPLPANGATLRLVALQATGHPISVQPTEAVEACGTGEQGMVSYGYVSQFPSDDGHPSIAASCQQAVTEAAAYAKAAQPLGLTPERYITSGSEIQYRLSFAQREGSQMESAVFLDTLSPHLLPLSLRQIHASHPVNVQWSPGNVLIIALQEGVQLAAGEQGFVQYRIRLRDDLPDHTLVERRTAILLNGATDYQALPASFHTVLAQAFQVETTSTETPLAPPLPNLAPFPNPSREVVSFFLSNHFPSQMELDWFDARGRWLHSTPVSPGLVRLPTPSRTPGLYLYRLRSLDGRHLAGGKVVVVD